VSRFIAVPPGGMARGHSPGSFPRNSSADQDDKSSPVVSYGRVLGHYGFESRVPADQDLSK